MIVRKKLAISVASRCNPARFTLPPCANRLKAPPHHLLAYHHCVSRVVNREFILGPEKKEEFVRLMRLYEELCEVRVVTYCIMSNHLHILVEVPLLYYVTSRDDWRE